MGFKEDIKCNLEVDVKYMLNKDWEPKVPGEKIITKQVKQQLKRGRSSGNVSLDLKAMRDKDDENVR
jgi:hypothetical protein